MRVLVLGGTGFIGRNVVNGLGVAGHRAVVLSRNKRKALGLFGDNVEIVEGDPLTRGEWQKTAAAADGVIILLGEPVMGKRWTPERKQSIIESRIEPTKLVVEAIAGAAKNPGVLLCGSAIGFYGNRGGELLTEESSAGEGFAADLNIAWESEADKAAAFGVRVVNLRTSFVLASRGGGLEKMVKPFRLFAGGPMGSGNQYMSWIHIKDYVGLTMAAIENSAVSGPLNMSSPNPVTNREFAKALGSVLKRPAFLKTPAAILKMIFGEASGLMLESQRVLPKKAQEFGYRFSFNHLDNALADLLKG